MRNIILIKLIQSAQTVISECEYFHKTKLVPTYMYLYHFTQITLKIQPVFKLLAKASHNEEGDCSHPIDASSAWLDSANCTNSPHKMTFLYRYPLRTLFEVLKNPFRRSNLHKTENYQGFFDLNPAKYRSFRDFVDRWKDFRRRQADGDDHWPVTVTSKNVFPRCQLNMHVNLWNSWNKGFADSSCLRTRKRPWSWYTPVL